ncbi:MAG: hypothetical protein ACK4NS_03120, partial [Saprospiraceae bacterium]
MPDNSHIAELLTRLNEIIAQIKKTGGVPVHPDLPRAFDVVAEILALIEAPEFDLETLIRDIEAFRQTLQAQGADMALIQDKIILFANQLGELTSAMSDKVDAGNVLDHIAEALNPISAALSDLSKRLVALEEAAQGAEGVSETRVRDMVEAALTPIREEIRQIKDREDPRMADLLQRIGALEKQTGNAGGISLTEAQALVADAVANLNILISSLRNEFEQKLALKVAQTEFDDFIDQNRLALSAKANQSDLDETNAALAAKTNKTDFNTFKGEIQQQLADKADKAVLDQHIQDTSDKLALKADQSALEQCKADLESELDKKADKAALDQHIQDTSDKLALKADQSALDQCKAGLESELDKKADKAALDQHIQDTSDKLALKADQSALEQCKSDLESELDKKADKAALDQHIQDTSDKLALKADQSALEQCKADLESELDKKADKAALDQHIQDTSDKLALKADQSALDQCKAGLESEL